MRHHHPGQKTGPAIPVIGHLLLRHNLKKTAALARDGNVLAARSLARQYCRCPDGTTENLLRSLMAGSADPTVADALCQEALESGDDLLFSTLSNERVVPSTTKGRVLFYFATGHLEDYRAMDPLPGHPLLREAYFSAEESVRKQIRSAAVRYHAESIFSDAIAGMSPFDPALQLTLEEWIIIVTGRISASRHKDIYRFLADAPVPFALYAVNALKTSGWSPDNIYLRELWDRVTTAIPERWLYPDLFPENRSFLESPISQTRFLGFSPDGSILVTSGYEGKICMWDVRSGDLLSSSGKIGSIGGSPIFSPDGRFMLIPGRDGHLTVRAVPTGKSLFSIPGSNREQCTVAVSHDSSLVAFTRTGGGIAISSIADGSPVTVSDQWDSRVTSLAFGPDGTTLACGSGDGTIRLLRVSNGSILWESAYNRGCVVDLAFLPDGCRIIVSVEKGYPAIVDKETGSLIHLFETPSHKPRRGYISGNGRWIAVVSEDETISTFNAGDPSVMGYISGRNGGVATLAFAPEHQILLTGGISGIIRIFRPGKDIPEDMFTAHADWVTALAVSPDGKTLASAGWDGTTKLWRLSDRSLLRSLAVGAGTVTCLTASSDCCLLAAGTSEGLIRLWRIPQDEFNTTIDAFTGSVIAIAISNDGTLLSTAGSDATVRIWQVPGGSLIATLPDLKSRTYSLAFTSDGSAVLAGGWDGNVRLFSLPGGELLRTFTGHTNIITDIVMIPDGNGFVSASFDGTCRIWDLKGKKAPAICTGSGPEIDAVAISADGNFIAAADRAGTIRIFGLEDGRYIYAMNGAPSRVSRLLFVPKGDLLVASGHDGSITYFSVYQRTHIRNFSAHAGDVCGLAIVGDDLIASAGSDGTVRLIPLPLTASLSVLTPDIVPVAAQQARDHPDRPERLQWQFLASLLALKFLDEICLSGPLPSLGEFDIMIMG